MKKKTLNLVMNKNKLERMMEYVKERRWREKKRVLKVVEELIKKDKEKKPEVIEE